MRKKIKDLHIYLNPEKKAHAEVLRKIEAYQEMFGVSVRDAIIALLLYSSITVVPKEFDSKQLIGSVPVIKLQVPNEEPVEKGNSVDGKKEQVFIASTETTSTEVPDNPPVEVSVEENITDNKDYLDMTTDEQLRAILLSKYNH